jgi:hypothetical protein
MAEQESREAYAAGLAPRSALIVVAAALVACGDKTRTGPMENGLSPTRVDVGFRGKPVARVTEAKTTLTFTAPARQRTYEIIDDLTFDVESPCGKKRLRPASDVSVYPDEEGFRVQVGRSYRTLFVDNRAGPARKLTLGETTFDVPADVLFRRAVYVEQCPDPLRIAIDGEKLGDAGDWRTFDFLVDPTGVRCYELTKVDYGGIHVGAYTPETKQLRRARLHSTGAIVEHMLENAPDKVETLKVLGGATRHQILEVACDP